MTALIPQRLSVSIVSHQQANLIQPLLADLDRFCRDYDLEVILTLNLPEELPFAEHDYRFPIKLIRNAIPLGFGSNHNQAFNHASGSSFCVLNPDIRLTADPFPPLLAALEHRQIGLIAPLVVNGQGFPEDSARHFPTPLEIIGKVFGGKSRTYATASGTTSFPDWVAGMFMLLRHDTYKEIGGFNERYFMYYEDVDLCFRLREHDYEIALCGETSVIHDARRSSHKKLRYLKWHATSMMRFFLLYYRKKIFRC